MPSEAVEEERGGVRCDSGYLAPGRPLLRSTKAPRMDPHCTANGEPMSYYHQLRVAETAEGRTLTVPLTPQRQTVLIIRTAGLGGTVLDRRPTGPRSRSPKKKSFLHRSTTSRATRRKREKKKHCVLSIGLDPPVAIPPHFVRFVSA